MLYIKASENDATPPDIHSGCQSPWTVTVSSPRLDQGLSIFSRHMDMSNMQDSWTCSRSSDERLVQIDFALGGLQFFPG